MPIANPLVAQVGDTPPFYKSDNGSIPNYTNGKNGKELVLPCECGCLPEQNEKGSCSN